MEDMLNLGITIDELADMGEVWGEAYPPSDSYEYFDGENFYNGSGQKLRPLSDYDSWSEGYTPFGDE
ncbi:MAG: hypothetical protein ACOC4D_00055 [Bacteroidota bacterium]